MGAVASKITSLTIVYSIVYSDADQRKHQTGEFPAQMASNTENVSIWWRHHVEQLDSPHKWQADAEPWYFFVVSIG